MSKILKHIVNYRKFSSYLELKEYIEIPNIQRDLIHIQIIEMSNYIRRCIQNNIEPVFGTLDLVNINGTSKLYICDGQHRFFAIKNEYENYSTIVPIHTLIYTVDSYEELVEIYKLRNMGVKVPDYYLSIEKDIIDKKGLLQQINSFLSGLKLFRMTGKTRPYVNINDFVDAFTKSKFFNLINTIEDFKNLLYAINQVCYNEVNSMDERRSKKLGISSRMIDTMAQYDWFIGYDLNYPYFEDNYNHQIILNSIKNFDSR